MAIPAKVTLRAQWLGKMLKELREDSGMTLKEPSEHIRRSTSTLSRYESGTVPVPQDEVLELMNLYGVEGEHQRSAMLQLAEEITKTGWWDRYAKDVWGSTVDYVWLENQAEALRIFGPLVIPGLLQTSEYAERLARIGAPNASLQQIERWVSVRLARQEILTRDEPTKVHLILDEAALRRPVGGADVMRDQLRRLLSEAEEPNIEVRVLPFSAGEYPGTDGSFALIKPSDPFPEVVHIESSAGTIFLEANDVLTFATQYDRIKESCLGPDESTAFIAAIEKDLS